jgi:hypothetical protein
MTSAGAGEIPDTSTSSTAAPAGSKARPITDPFTLTT